jgi:hypothetical protein
MADSIPFSFRALFRRLRNHYLLAFIAHASNAPIWGYPVAFSVNEIFGGHVLTSLTIKERVPDSASIARNLRRSPQLLQT